MISERVILDTGVLVALLNRRDSYHSWSVAQWKQVKSPALTCDAVISEACFLLKRGYLIDAVFEMIAVGAIRLAFDLQAEADNVRVLMKRYESVPISIADACLVRMSELIPDSTVMTLDSDFQIYRRFRKEEISVIQPKLF